MRIDFLNFPHLPTINLLIKLHRARNSSKLVSISTRIVDNYFKVAVAIVQREKKKGMRALFAYPVVICIGELA